jgi:hypothetical protein
MKRTWPKSGSGRTAIRPPVGKSTEDMSAAAKPAPGLSEKLVQLHWPRRPRIIQFNAGRVEISVPYQLAIAMLLGIVLIVLVFYRMGQMRTLSKEGATDSTVETEQNAQLATTSAVQTAAEQAPPSIEPTEPEGDNRIVIQTYQLSSQLEPVKQYFADFGIETEIKRIDEWYYLVTKDKYDNPQKPGTDGYLAKQRIIELGAQYKAPMGFETFGKEPFHDAYGMKFDD